MADEKEQKNKEAKVNQAGIKTPAKINTDGSSRLFVHTADNLVFNLAHETYNLTGIDSALRDTAIISSLESRLLEMPINTIGDATNFLVGVNNIASQFSLNSGLLHAIDSSRLTLEAIEQINVHSVTQRLHLATEYQLKANEVLKLSESVTTVLAYGQAVQNQFDTIISNSEMVRDRVAVLSDSAIALGKISNYISTNTTSRVVTSPFIFTPQKIKTKEVTKVLPEVKKDLPAKTVEAIDLMEYALNPDTKNDDTRINTTVAELKRAIKNIHGSIVMYAQQTIQKVEITAMPKLEVSTGKDTQTKSKFPFKIPAGTNWQNIIIQFTSADYVNVQVAGHSHSTGYAEMGFIDGRTGKPTIQWGLLQTLAKNGGTLSWKSADASDNLKKHKQLLSEKLKEYFGIDYDPFEPYTNKKSYKVKLVLISPTPEPTKSSAKAIDTDNEIDDIFRELGGA